LSEFITGEKPREGAGAKVVAVRKAAGKDHRIVTRKISFTVPDEVYGLTDVLGDHVISVVIAIRTGKNYNSEFHASNSTR
jgi:hypothetical protein